LVGDHVQTEWGVSHNLTSDKTPIKKTALKKSYLMACNVKTLSKAGEKGTTVNLVKES